MIRRVLFTVIRLGSLVVPAGRRESWRREWSAEVGYALHTLEGRGRRGLLARASLIVRTCWCLTDAAWVRAEAVSVREIGRRVRSAWRGLKRTPGVTASVLLTLAVGIGACTALFSVAYAVLLRPLPFPEPSRLAVIWAETRSAVGRPLPVDAPDVALIREQARAFEGISFVRTVTDGTLDGEGEAESIALARVTGNFFDVLGVSPELGRGLKPGDGRLTPAQAARDDDDLTPLPPTAVVLSHGLWVRRFGGDPAVLGRAVQIDGNPAVVVGVMPAEFRVPAPAGSGIPSEIDAWTPVRFDLSLLRRTERLEDQDSRNGGIVLARLRNGVSAGAASRELAAASTSLRRESTAGREAGFRLVLAPLRDEVGRAARPLLLALLGAAGLVLLVGCLNVAGLLLARSLARGRDRAVRVAMGADRGRLILDALTEAGVLAVLGGGVGVALAVLGAPRLVGLLPESIPRLSEATTSLPALAFAALVAALSVLVFGTIPALRAARVDPALVLSGGRSLGTRGATSIRMILVGGQLALVTVLVMGSALLLRTVENLERTDLGFQPDGVMTFDLSLVLRDGYRGPADRARFLSELEQRLSGLPGVRAVGTTGILPLSGRRFEQPYALAGQGSLGADPGRRAAFRVVTGGYFRAVGTKVLAGRSFIPADDDQNRRVAIVDEALARRISGRHPTAAAVGTPILIPVDGEEVRAEIVGVVESGRQDGLRAESEPAVYVPYRHEASRNVSVLVRTAGSTEALSGPIRAALRDMDPRLAIHGMRTLESLVSRQVAPTRFFLGILVAFGALALLLAGIGVFGLVAYEARSRRREIGVRAALGATRGRLLGKVLRRSLAVGGGGTLVGVGVTLGISRLVGSVIYEASPAEPGILAFASAVVLAVTALGSWIPARSAARTDPMEVLREE